MDQTKLANALEQTANLVSMNGTNAMGVYRTPLDSDATYAMRVLAATLRGMS